MKMMMKIKLLVLFISAHLLLIGTFILLNESLVLINIELAFFASLFIVFASYQGYKKMVMHSVANDAILEIKDPLDKIDDPYDLYDEVGEDEEALDQKDLKKRLKKDGMKKMVKTAAGHVSLKRISSYIVLVLVFMGLNNNEMLHVTGFLSGLGLGIITAGFAGPRLIK